MYILILNNLLGLQILLFSKRCTILRLELYTSKKDMLNIIIQFFTSHVIYIKLMFLINKLN